MSSNDKRPASTYREAAEAHRKALTAAIQQAISDRLESRKVSEILASDVLTRYGIDAKLFSDWKSRSIPPIWLWEPLSLELFGDPFELARIAGLVPSEGDIADLVEQSLTLQHHLTRLQEQHLERLRIVDELPSAGAGAIVAALCSAGHSWQIAVTPAIEGPPGCPMHVADRLDFRRTDGRAARSSDLEQLLSRQFSIFDVVDSRHTPGRWAEPPEISTDSETGVRDVSTPDSTLRFSIDHVQRQCAPLSPTPYAHLRSMCVVTPTSLTWGNDVAALVSRILGFGFATTRALGKTGFGYQKPQAARKQSAVVHRQLLASPWRRYVWGHISADVSPGSLLPEASFPHDAHTIFVLIPRASSDFSSEDRREFEQTAIALTSQVEELQSVGLDVLSLDVAITPVPVDRQARVGRRAVSWERTLGVAYSVVQQLADQNLLTALDLAFAHDQLSMQTEGIAAQVYRWGVARGFWPGERHSPKTRPLSR